MTVSYFEWVKNLSHVRFGRVGKRFEEAAAQRMLAAIEQVHRAPLRRRRAPADRAGPDEIDLVNSGLEQTMISAYQQIREIKQRDNRIHDLRTAAFVGAITKVAQSYLELGFPRKLPAVGVRDATRPPLPGSNRVRRFQTAPHRILTRS